MEPLNPKRLWMIHAWDFLFFLTVFFPLFSGGIWFHAGHTHIELAQINAPVIALGILGFILEYYIPGWASESRAIRLLQKFWDFWRARLELRPHQTLWAAVAFLTCLWSAASISRHWGFQTTNADMGIFTNGIWNFSQGNGFISSMKSGANLLTDHQSPIFMLLVPIFWLAPFPETLLICQAFGLLTGGVALYWIARQYLPKEHAAVAWLPLAYCFFSPLRNVNRFDFHPEVFMLPLFLWALAGLQSEKKSARAWGALAFLLALGAKESAGPVGFGICLAWFAGAAPAMTRAFTRWLALALTPVCLGIFIFDTTVVPGLFGRKYNYEASYGHLGGHTSQILLAPLLQPGNFLRALTEGDRVKIFFASLLPVMLLPLLNPRAFLASLPGYMMILLTAGSQRISLGYHYSIEFSVGIFWALPGAVLVLEKFLTRRTKFRGFQDPRILAVAAVFLFGCYGRSDLFYLRSYPTTAHQRWLKQEVFPCLTQDSYAVPDPYTPQLSLRPWVHFVPILEKPENSGNYVSCVMLDDAVPLSAKDQAATAAQIQIVQYKEIYRCGGLRILESPLEQAHCMRCIPDCKN